MSQEQGVILAPVAGIPKSRSDRPWPLRAGLATWDFTRQKPLGAFGFFLILISAFGAIFSPLVARYSPTQIFTEPNHEFNQQLYDESLVDPTVKIKYADQPQLFNKEDKPLFLTGPSSAHWLGTDNHGQDIYARIIYGAKLSLFVGIFASILATVLGTFLGVVSGYFGGWVDMIIQRFTDALYAFPPLILLLLIIQVVDKPNKYWITLALGILGISQVIRIVRSSVLSTREEQYVLAARSTGASDLRVMARHIVPNIVAPLIVIFTIAIGAYILAEAGLEFIGFGDPVAISWGKMVDEGRQLGTSSPLYALWVGLAITFSVLGFNLAGDALRDVLDPRLRGRSGRAGF
jgi:peptide/nickel transport system permease protein